MSVIKVSIDNTYITKTTHDTNKDLVMSLKLPKDMHSTLYGKYSLREKLDSYFLISTNDIGTRKGEPHVLKIEFECMGRDYEEIIKFDTLDTYLSNVNSKLSKTTLNDEEYIKLEDWINTENGE